MFLERANVQAHAIRLAVLVMFCLLAEAVCQLGYRVIRGQSFWQVEPAVYAESNRPHVTFTPYGMIEYAANTTAYMVDYPAVLHTDRHGLIHNGTDRAWDPNDWYVVVLGGSTVEGRGASSNATTLVAQLEQRLNAQRPANAPHVVVLNAGFPGHMSYQQLGRIDGWVSQDLLEQGVRPRLIVALDGRNDAFYLAAYADSWHPNWQPYFDSLRHDVNAVQQATVSVAVRAAVRGVMWLSYHSAFVYAFEQALKPRAPAAPPFPQRAVPPAPMVARAASAYVNNHIVAKARAATLGAQYLVFLQPTLSADLKPQPSAGEQAAMHTWGQAFYDPQVYWQTLQGFYPQARGQAAGLDYFHDLSGLFAHSAATLYWDSCHYNDAGNAKLAQAMAAVIGPLLTTPALSL